MPISHAILGFLEYQPMSGYDLKKLFDQSVAHFWSAAQSQIYKALEKLEEEGLVTSKIIPQEGKPNRKEYHSTKAGRAELKKWLSTPLPLAPVREAWMIQLFFAHSLSNEEIATVLGERKKEILKVSEELEQARAAMEQSKAGAAPGMERMSALWQMTLDYGIDFYIAELAWLDKTLKRIPKLPPMK